MKKKKTETRVTTKPEEITAAIDNSDDEESIEAPATAADFAALAAGGRVQSAVQSDEWEGPVNGAPEPDTEEEPAAEVPETDRVDYSALEHEGLRRTETYDFDGKKSEGAEAAESSEKPGGRRGASSRRKKGGGVKKSV